MIEKTPRPGFDEPLGPYLACLAVFVVYPSLFIDFSFLTENAAHQWLINDYMGGLLPLAVIFFLPSVRACVRSSFGPLAWPVLPPRYLTLFLILCVCVFVDWVIWDHLRPQLAKVLPDARIESYPMIENTALAWFDVTAGLALTAISEEIGFRAVMARVMQRFTANTVVIILLSALIFGVSHWKYGLPNVISASISGIMYMGLYLKTGSIVPFMAVHYVSNLIQFYPWYFD